MINRLSLAVVSLMPCLASQAAMAGPNYANPAQHFSLVAPDGLVPLTADQLARGNAAKAAEGGTPILYEAGFAPPVVPGTESARLPLLLIRFVPGRSTLRSFAVNYQSDLARESALAASMAGEATTRPAAPRVVVDNVAFTVSTERRHHTTEGDVLKHKTVFLGHDGVVEVDWTGPAGQAAASLRPVLASFHFDKGFDYSATDVVAVRTVAPANTGRRAVATAILIAVPLLFLAIATGYFLRARRRAAT